MTRQWMAGALAASLLLAALFAGSPARGTNRIAREWGLACTVCHDKPGSKLLTDKGKYFELMRSLDGYAQIKADFGSCTACHVRRPGSHRLTKKGRELASAIRDMKGLRALVMKEHPVAPERRP